MKRTILTTLLTLSLILLLAACSGANRAETGDSTSDTSSQTDLAADNINGDGIPNNTGTDDFAPGAMDPQTELILGTVLLDETAYPVDAEQAAALLPLWKALRSLGASETTAQAEIDALVAQIGSTLSAEQTAAISAMELSMADMAAVSEALGVETVFGGGRLGEMTPEMQATMQAARESGDFEGIQRPGGDVPGGGPGGGGGFGGGDVANLTPEEREALMAERGGRRGAQLAINSGLLDALIEFLEAKAE
jgi:hypothetical protein